VQTTADSGPGSLRQAIADADLAPGADEVRFAPGVAGTVVLASGPLWHGNDPAGISILGPGPETLTVDGNGAGTILEVSLEGEGSRLALSGLGLRNGGRGLSVQGWFAESTRIEVSDALVAATSEAGIVIEDLGASGAGTVSLQGVRIAGNGGDGLRLGAGDSTVSGSSLTDNGGLGIALGEGPSGSGLPLLVQGCLIARNGAGGLRSLGGGTLRVWDSRVVDNGGTGLWGTGLSVMRTTVAGNQAPSCAGLRASALSMRDSTVSGNRASAGDGGGICVFEGRQEASGSLKILSSTVSGNEAQGNGGGIYQYTGSTAIEGSAITANRAGTGGGLYKRFDDEALAAGDLFVEETRVANSILAGNLAPANPDIRCGPEPARPYVAPVALRWSLIGDPADAYLADAVAGSNRYGVDPLLGPLQDNGGPTQTQAPLPGSPAIDSGDPGSTLPPHYDCDWLTSATACALLPADWDQRGEGFERVRNGRIDLGAVELQSGEVPRGGAWLLAPGDIDGNGTPELLVVRRDGEGRDLVWVADATDGSGVRQFEVQSFGRLLDLGSFATPGGGMGLAALDSTANVQRLDLGSGAWLGLLSLDPGLGPTALALLADPGGAADPGLAVLGTDPPRVEVRADLTGEPVRSLHLPARFAPGALIALPDLNGNGSPELGVALLSPDEPDRVVVKDPLTRAWVGAVVPQWRAGAFELRQTLVGQDRDGDGRPELALLLRDPLRGDSAVWVADPATGAQLARVGGFHRDFVPVRLAAVADLTGNGVEEYALLAQRPDTGQAMVEIREGQGSGLVRRIWLGKGCTPIDLAGLPDLDGNGAGELAVLCREGRTRRLQVQIRDSGTGAELRRLDP
jgi:hypothetical protein